MREATDLSGLDRAGRVDLLRSRMAAIGGGQGAAPQPDMASPDVLPVHPELAKVLPGGGLERRAMTEVSDCPALIVELIGQVTARGGHVGVVGWPELSLADVVESGRLDNVITVPDPGTDPLGIVGILVEGLDLVVARWAAPLELSPVRARPLLARLRGGVAALVLVGARIPSPAVRIGAKWHVMTAVVSPGDFDGDGAVDVLARNAAGDLLMYRGNGKGGWAGSAKVGAKWDVLAQFG